MESVRQPPLQLGVLMGDFVHNLRSTLDQLVWQLALTQTDAPHDSSSSRSSTRDPLRLAGGAWSATGFSASHRRRCSESGISSHYSEQPCINALAIVHALSSEDKHRVILQPASVSKEPDDSNVEIDTNDVDILGVEIMFGAPPEPGATVKRVPYVIVGDGARVNLDVACPAEVYFGRIRFPALAMTDVAERIAGLVREFEPPLV